MFLLFFRSLKQVAKVKRAAVLLETAVEESVDPSSFHGYQDAVVLDQESIRGPLGRARARLLPELRQRAVRGFFPRLVRKASVRVVVRVLIEREGNR